MSPPDPRDFAERNIERLISGAYRPQAPTEEFERGTRERMEAQARAAAQARLAARPASPRFRRLRPFLAAAAAAAAFLAGVRLGGDDVRREGTVVWIDGKPYYPPAEKASPAPETGPAKPAPIAWTPADPPRARPAAAAAPDLPEGLTPRPRPAAPAPAERPASPGARIVTAAGERRRVALEDGSLLYLNGGTDLKIEAARRVALASGEIYVEAAPAPQGAPFVVAARGREFTALGTKFAVRAEGESPSLLVTHGRVKVSGLEEVVAAGQSLDLRKAGARPETPLTRASRALEWTRDLKAAALSPLVPKSGHAGGALIAVDPYGQEVHLSLRKVHVDVHIEDGFARTTIDQTYFNSSRSRMEGTFYFPLPAGASLSRLAMYVEGRLMEGGMAERDYARNVFEQIVTRQKDPALLEWVDGSTFKMRVFPLEARQEKRIILSYTERLPSLYGRARYRFPAGHNLALTRSWSFHARLKDGGTTAFACDSHALSASRDGKDLLLDGSAERSRLDRDLVLDLDDEGEGPPDARFSSFAHEGARYLMVRLRPEIPSAPRPARRDWVFLFESDGARDPLLARVQVEAVKALLDHAGPDDAFAIVTAGTRRRAFSKELRPADAAGAAEALKFLESTHLVGALDLGAALDAAAPFLRAGKNPHLVHLGAAVPILGERREESLVRRIPDGTTYVGVGVGKRWSRGFMRAAAARTGGWFGQVNPDEDVAWRAFEIHSTLSAPRLLGARVVDPEERLSFLSDQDALAYGEELAAVARIEKGDPPEKVSLAGTLDGKPFSLDLKVEGVEEDAAHLPRTWARLEIDRLLSENAEANKERVVALSKAMYVMSPFTSLLVLENEEMYAQFKVDRGRKDHWAIYPCPDRIPVVFEPDPAGPVDPRSVPREGTAAPAARPSAAEILDTILVRLRAPVLRSPNEPYYGQGGLTAGRFLSGAYGHGGYEYYNWGRADRTKRLEKWAEGNEIGQEGFDLSVTKLALAANLRAGFVSHEAGIGGRRVEERERKSRWDFDADGPAARGGGRARQRSLGQGIAGGNKDKEGRSLDALQDFRSPSPLWGGRSGPASGPVLAKAPAPMSPTRRPGGQEAASRFDEDAASFADRLFSGYGYAAVQYQRPAFHGDWRFFGDLPTLAPGMNTSWADILDVLEAEAAPDPLLAPGRIAPEAETLIEKARAFGWTSVAVPGEEPFAILCDGSGRYAWRTRTADGLEEIGVCDGKSLLHLYPEIGLGARRSPGRNVRASLQALVPWILPPAADLAAGADLEAVGPREIAVVPRGAAAARDAKGAAARHARVHLLFAPDGRLAARRIVEMPEGKAVYEETYGADGLVRAADGEGKVLSEQRFVLAPAAAPDLRPKLDGLVVLPLPLRTPAHVRALLEREGRKFDGRFDGWSEEDALEFLAADYAQGNGWEVQQIMGQRFLAQGDRRIGLYVLLGACGIGIDPSAEASLGNGAKVRFDPVRDHPESPLARYLLQQMEAARTGNQKELGPIGKDAPRFLAEMTAFRDLFWSWNQGPAARGDEKARESARERALAFAEQADPELAFAILGVAQNYGGGDAAFQRRLAGIYGRIEKAPGLAFAAQYERARALLRADGREEARRIFRALFRGEVEKGRSPAVDHEFRQAFQNDGPGQEEWKGLIREGFDRLVREGRRPEAIRLAWLCQQFGDAPLAEDLLAEALTGRTEKDRLAATLAAVEFLWHTNQLPRAEALLEPLLETGREASDPAVHRLAAAVAERRGRLAVGLARLERAMDLEWADLPDLVDVQAVREEFGGLLARYRRLADAVSTVAAAPSPEFIRRIVRAADRWRALDTDPTPACQAAAGALAAMGEGPLAWDYLTTPLADRPNEAAPWTALAQNLRAEGEFNLADRAYAEGFEAEPTDAQILWDRAQNLLQADRADEARALFRKIADGAWQPRFENLKRQAAAFSAPPRPSPRETN